MTAKYDRASEEGILADHLRRIRALEASPWTRPDGCCDPAIVCTDCFAIDPQFASCVSMKTGCTSIPPTTIGFQPAPGSILTSKVEIGHYRCNYEAGFRVVVRYTGDYKRLELFGEIWHNGVFFGRRSIGTYGPLLGPVDTGSWQIDIDPVGTGALTDNWQCYVGVENDSIIVDGQIGEGAWCVQYEYAANAQLYMPFPRYEGMIMTSIGSPPKWQALAAGTVGQVLTINAANKPEWM